MDVFGRFIHESVVTFDKITHPIVLVLNIWGDLNAQLAKMRNKGLVVFKVFLNGNVFQCIITHQACTALKKELFLTLCTCVQSNSKPTTWIRVLT